MTTKRTFYVGIRHHHTRGDYGVSYGQIEAESLEDAHQRSRFWVERKKRECGCPSHGERCTVDVLDPSGLPWRAQLAFSSSEKIGKPE